jgi:hypothetical protein
LRRKPTLQSGTRWPIALQDFVRAGGCPFNTQVGGDNRTRLSAECQEPAIPVPTLILPGKFAASLLFLRDRWFHSGRYPQCEGLP